MNGRASGPVLLSVFLAVFDHSVVMKVSGRGKRKEEEKSKERAGHAYFNAVSGSVAHSCGLMDVKRRESER